MSIFWSIVRAASKPTGGKNWHPPAPSLKLELHPQIAISSVSAKRFFWLICLRKFFMVWNEESKILLISPNNAGVIPGQGEMGMWGMDVSQTYNAFRRAAMPVLVSVHGHPFHSVKCCCSCREFKQAFYSTLKFKIMPKSKWRHFSCIMVSVTRGTRCSRGCNAP